MKKYTFKLPDYGLEFTFKFDDNDYLIAFALEEGEPDKIVFEYLGRYFPTTFQALNKLYKSSKNAKLKEIKEDVSFEDFWENYGHKVDKKPAEKIWKNMTKKERAEAFEYIHRYNQILNFQGIAKKYPKTYLRQQPWRS